MGSYKYVYVDESGEFGLSPDSSDYLLVVGLKTNDPRAIEKIAKKVWSNLGLSKTRAQEIHATDASDRVVHKMLTLLNTKDIAVEAYIYKKPRDSQVDVHIVYYEMLERLIADNENTYSIVIDRRDTNKKRREMIAQLKRPHIFSRVLFEDSRKMKQLQVVDVVAWALFQKFEFSIQEYIENIDTHKVTMHMIRKRKPSALTNH